MFSLPDVLSSQIFCLSGCFVPPDVSSLRMFCPWMLRLRRFVWAPILRYRLQHMIWFYAMGYGPTVAYSTMCGYVLWATARYVVLCSVPQHMIWFYAMEPSTWSSSALWATAMIWFYAAGHSTGPCSTQWAKAHDLVPHYGPQHMIWFYTIGHSTLCGFALWVTYMIWFYAMDHTTWPTLWPTPKHSWKPALIEVQSWPCTHVHVAMYPRECGHESMCKKLCILLRLAVYPCVRDCVSMCTVSE